jgi:uncharacterized protein YjbJ (UPF0337 family)
MKASTRNRVEGKYREVKGTFKETFGGAVNNRRVALAGCAEKIAGKVQRKFGRAEKAIGW